MSLGPFQATSTLLRRFRRLTRGIARKGPVLHPKHTPHGMSKGYGAKGMGHFTRKGAYIIDWQKRVPHFVVPDLTDCKLQPYVSARTPKVVVPPPPDSIGGTGIKWQRFLEMILFLTRESVSFAIYLFFPLFSVVVFGYDGSFPVRSTMVRIQERPQHCQSWTTVWPATYDSSTRIEQHVYWLSFITFLHVAPGRRLFDVIWHTGSHDGSVLVASGHRTPQRRNGGWCRSRGRRFLFGEETQTWQGSVQLARLCRLSCPFSALLLQSPLQFKPHWPWL